MQKVIVVFISLMYLRSGTLLRHIVLVAVASVCMIIKTLEVEVPTLFSPWGVFRLVGRR
jgi:hypothetical protein